MKVGFELYDVKTRVPEKSGDYLTVSLNGMYWTVVHWSSKHQCWNARDYETEPSRSFLVDYWTELPSLEGHSNV